MLPLSASKLAAKHFMASRIPGARSDLIHIASSASRVFERRCKQPDNVLPPEKLSVLGACQSAISTSTQARMLMTKDASKAIKKSDSQNREHLGS
jgi:hypothetical protein